MTMLYKGNIKSWDTCNWVLTFQILMYSSIVNRNYVMEIAPDALVRQYSMPE